MMEIFTQWKLANITSHRFLSGKLVYQYATKKIHNFTQHVKFAKHKRGRTFLKASRQKGHMIFKDQFN